MDSYYSSNKDKLQQYVLKREEEIRLINEADAIARQKEVEARKARENAEKMKEELGVEQ